MLTGAWKLTSSTYTGGTCELLSSLVLLQFHARVLQPARSAMCNKRLVVQHAGHLEKYWSDA
jgi:hypothetical protein